MKHESVCSTKKSYPTEWEALHACVRYESHMGDEMVPYLCRQGAHYHITHKDRTKSRGAGKGFKRCICGEMFRTTKKKKPGMDFGRLDTHQKTCDIYKEWNRKQQLTKEGEQNGE